MKKYNGFRVNGINAIGYGSISGVNNYALISRQSIIYVYVYVVD